MNKLPTLITFNDSGEVVKREKVHIMFAWGEEEKRHRTICFDLPNNQDGMMRGIYITPKALAEATGLIVREPKKTRKAGSTKGNS